MSHKNGDRERSRDRPGHQSTSSGSGGVLSILSPLLFGKRSTPTSRSVSLPEGRPPRPGDERGRPAPTAGDSSRRRAPTPPPFDPEKVISLIARADPKDDVTTAEVCEYVKAIAVYLVDRATVTVEDESGGISTRRRQDPHHAVGITSADLETLYIKSKQFANPRNPRSLRTASKRLLAALIAIAPPGGGEGVIAITLPPNINVRGLYDIITSPATTPGPSPSIDEIFVEVGALKALTKNGAEVSDTEGIIGWLVRTVTELSEDYVAWCLRNEDPTAEQEVDPKRKTPWAPIKPASPPEALSAIIDLISAILSSHAPLITSDDIKQILAPILAVFYKSLAAELKVRPAESSLFGLSQTHDSPVLSAINSPIFMAPLVMESAVRRSVSIKRKPESLSSSVIGTPQSKPTARQSSGASDSVTSPPYPSSPHVHSPTSPPPTSTSAKWSSALPSFCGFLEALLRSSAIPDESFAPVVALICITLGQLPMEVVPEADQAAANLITQILATEKSQRSEVNIRLILEGNIKNLVPSFVPMSTAMEARMTKGAVSATQVLLQHMEANAGKGDSPSTCMLASVAPSLCAAQSTSRWKDPSDRAKWEMVDFAILTLILDHLNNLRELDSSQHASLGDAWAEGEAVTEILEGFIPLISAFPLNLQEVKDAVSSNPQKPFSAPEVSAWIQRRVATSQSASVILPLFAAVLLVLPDSVGHLHASTSQGPAFVHPRYIELLLMLGPSLDEADAKTVIDFYVEECLCLPFTTGWIENIWKLLHAFYAPSSQLRQAKSNIAKLISGDVYDFVEDLPEHRQELVNKVIVPFSEKELLDEPDDELQQAALSVLTRAAVAETMELDEESRIARANKDSVDLENEDASPQPQDDLINAAASGSFHAIRALVVRVATLSACAGESLDPLLPSASADRRGPKSRDATPMTGFSKAFAGQISPPTRASPLPSISAVTVPSAPMSPMSEASDLLPFGTPAPSMHNHDECRSLHAVSSLIAIFSRLAFSPSHSHASIPRATRTPASIRCITIFRDLLGLLFPMTDVSTSTKPDPVTPKIPARCPRARLVVLQWLMRLRADKRHRVQVRSRIDEAAMPFAALLKRTKETEADARLEVEDSRRRPRPSGGSRLADEDRGRTVRGREEPTRSRSRSKQPIIRGVDHTYNPLWTLPGTTPEALPLDMGDLESPSDCLMTFDPNHPSLRVKGPPAEGIWLPVSEYVRVLNGILRGHDWELVSYVFTFLPLQLRNKAFFHGPRAVQEVRALLDVLCSGIVNTENRWERRYNVPVFIKRFDINGIAYQSLSVLIGYRGVFSTDDCNKLVGAFAAGLESKRELAKPCLQALTLCIYELEPVLAKHLVGKGSEDMGILDKLPRIVTTTALAVHILEFLIALGQNGNLYRNFTDEQYRKIFHVAIDYITIHNARSDLPIDLTKFREEYTLSQHVIGLAYYSIYIWFMALKLPQRPNLVPEITRKLLQGRSQRTGLDEMAEVCFDWLARYTYSNADPKPAASFLSEVVMQDGADADPPRSFSWMLGGAIITITSHARSGWATINTTRPTGATAIVCKLENIPLLELGEANADLVSLPAFLMANRKPDPGSGNLDDPSALASARSTAPPPEIFNQSQHGYIWTGATPSQRRKDVLIEPSYLALQLLSSYPNASLETPRGLLIPNEEKFARSLRGIQNTPVIDTLKIAVLYVEAGQTTETEILGNVDGSPLYLDFLSGLGRLLRLKGQVDVYVGGLNRDDDSDGAYAYAWWDEFSQMVFHVPTMMPNNPNQPTYDNKKRHIGNDFVKIIYNETGKDLDFDLIKTAFNFVNIIVSPLTIGESDITSLPLQKEAEAGEEGWADWDREDWFKVEVQRAPGVPDFGPLGEGRLVSRKALPILVRGLAYLADGLSKRSKHIREASDAASAEYITNWRSRLRAMARMRSQLPPRELPPESDTMAREELLRDFTRSFSHKPPVAEKD